MICIAQAGLIHIFRFEIPLLLSAGTDLSFSRFLLNKSISLFLLLSLSFTKVSSTTPNPIYRPSFPFDRHIMRCSRAREMGHRYDRAEKPYGFSERFKLLQYIFVYIYILLRKSSIVLRHSAAVNRQGFMIVQVHLMRVSATETRLASRRRRWLDTLNLNNKDNNLCLYTGSFKQPDFFNHKFPST